MSVTDSRSFVDPLGRLTTRKLPAILLLVAFLLVVGAVMAMAPSTSERAAPDPVPSGADSSRVSEIAEEFPGGDKLPAVMVVAREDGKLTEADRADVADLVEQWAEISGAEVSGPVPSEDGQAELYIVPLPNGVNSSELGSYVDDIRGSVTDADLDGVTIELTGGAGFSSDISESFSGADVRLLLVTGAVVAVLLILTYRSPLLWLVPLVVIAIADRTAAVAVEIISQNTGNWLDGSTAGITSVLVFGAGTNYALLLVSRYREELRRHDDHRAALRAAMRGAVPAIVASNVTVVVALLALLAAVIPSSRILGIAASIGLLIALVFALLALPAALSLCGRRLFWPFIPRFVPEAERKEAEESGAWFAVARGVARRPMAVLLISVVALGALATGLTQMKIGLAQTDQFEVEAESIDGLETLSQHFPAGAADPVTVMTRAKAAEKVLKVVNDTDGVVSARPSGESETGWVRITADLGAEPSSEESQETLRDLRDRLDRVNGADAVVGGNVASQLDSSDAAMRDLMVVIPLILLVVFVVLIFVLGNLAAPLVLLGINLLSSLAALGVGVWVSEYVFNFPAFDVNTPLFVVLFLVALGIDYTVFLVLRAQEETVKHGTRAGIVRAVGLTGSVITSAGVVLAAVFVVLAMLPLVTLTQVGVIVGIGILIDTFLVRSIVVPAVFSMLGDRVWAWPLPGRERLAGGARAATQPAE